MLKARLNPWLRVWTGLIVNESIGELLSRAHALETQAEREAWVEAILTWLMRKDGDTSVEARFKYLFNRLDQNPEIARACHDAVSEFFRHESFLGLFLLTGYTNEHGLWSETAKRLLRRFLPSIRTGRFDVLFARLLEGGDAAWADQIPVWVLEKLDAWLRGPSSPVSEAFSSELREAILILGANIAHLGLTQVIRARAEKRRMASSSPFWKVGRLSDDGAEDGLAEAIAEARARISGIYEEIERTGVSVEIVHTLETLSSSLDRLELLARIARLAPGAPGHAPLRDLLRQSAEASLTAGSVRRHLAHHFDLLSRKIAERNSASGEHYIARTPGELNSILWSAMGGGLIVVGMSLGKILLGRLGLAPIFMAIGSWIIYSSGFLAMQAMGFTLATKIPSFAASRLAQWIKDARTKNDIHLFNREVSAVFRSQAVALFGNLLTVIPFAWGLEQFFSAVFDASVMKPEYAAHLLHELDPSAGLVFVLGALTGLELWISSLCGGWFENFVRFHDIPNSIATNPRLLLAFGEERTKSMADRFLHESSGIAANVALGFLFGFVPMLGTLFGVDLNSMHVTIASSGATFAVSLLEPAKVAHELAFTAIGLGVVGLMNFGVSFAAAAVVAVRAQRIRRSWFWGFVRSWRKPSA